MKITEKQKLVDEAIKNLKSEIELIRSGYAGILSDGTIVDRREFQKAIPLQENKFLNIPEPKKL